MFSHIGGKIKSISVVLFGLEVFVAIIAALVFLIDSITSGAELGILWAFVCGIAGPIAAYISACFLYGFGELIEKVQIIASNDGNAQKPESSDPLPPL